MLLVVKVAHHIYSEKLSKNFSKSVAKNLFFEYNMYRKAGDILLVWLTP